MTVIAMPAALERALGPEGAEALGRLLTQVAEDGNKDMLSRTDEKVQARYEVLLRRVHEDIAGVEIRMTRTMSDLEGKLTQRMADLEVRVLRWTVTALVINAGLMLLTGWIAKRFL